MDCSMPGFPVHHRLLYLAQIHGHQVDDAIQPSHPLLSPSPPAVNLSQHQGLIQWVSSSHLVAKVLSHSCEQVKLLSHVQLFVTPWTIAHQAPPSMEFSKQEYWSGLAFPPPGDLPNPGIKPGSPALRADALISELPGNPIWESYNPKWGFLGGSDGKESACNARGQGLIPGSGRYPGEWNSNPLQYSCPENFMDRGAWWATVHGVAELDTTERLPLSYSITPKWKVLWQTEAYGPAEIQGKVPASSAGMGWIMESFLEEVTTNFSFDSKIGVSAREAEG